MEIQNEMPLSGQFIVIWEHEGELWSDVWKVEVDSDGNEITSIFDEDTNKFQPCKKEDIAPYANYSVCTNIHYVTK